MKGHAESARIGPGEYEHSGSSVDDVRVRFLTQIHQDAPYVLEALRATDGSEPALLAWAASWHLQDEWVLDVARRTILEWRAYPVLAKGMHWSSAIQTGELVPEPEAVQWLPTMESAEEFLSRVKREYIPAVRHWATAIGLVGTPQKPKLTRDLSALVQYHVKGDDLDAVADEFFGGEEDSARKALSSLAKLVGVTLRK